MKASPRQQRLLLRLQEHDTEQVRLNRRRNMLPEISELERLEAQDSELRDSFMSAQRAVEELATEIARIEDDTRVVSQRAERTSARLGTSVSGKEAQALQEEVDMLDRRRRALEDRELEFMELQETATAAFDEAASRLSQHDAAKQTLREKIRESHAAIDAEAARIAEERAGLAAEVRGDVLEVYERTRERYGIGAARLVGRVSEGSNLELDAGDYSVAVSTPEDELYFCPASGAILVRNWEEAQQS